MSLNNELTQEIVIDETNLDVVHLVTFDRGFSSSGDNRVQIEVEGGPSEGGRNLMYQVATRYYLPWDRVAPSSEAKEPIAIDINYDRTTLAVNDQVTVTVGVRLNEAGVVKMALIDLGVLPGFTVLAEDESAGGARRHLSLRVDRTTDHHLPGGFGVGNATDLELSAAGTLPDTSTDAASSAYDYYNPSSLTMQPPLEVTVGD